MSADAGHTKGPWRWVGEGILANSDGDEIINSSIALFDEPDARLIAAAPELLEALKEIAKFFDQADGDGWTCPVWTEKKARAVLAKAERA